MIFAGARARKTNRSFDASKTKRGVEARDAPALPPCIWKAIFDEVARDDDIYRAPLRLVCRDWLAWATVPQRRVGHERLLLRAAADGLVGICELARGWMLAEYDERIDLPDWDERVVQCGIYEYVRSAADGMAEAGAANDRAEVVALARRWGALPDLAGIAAADNGNVAMCCYVLEWGLDQDGIEDMLLRGYSGGHEDVCRLAIMWGARGWISVLNANVPEDREMATRIQKSLSRIWNAEMRLEYGAEANDDE